MRTFNVTFDRPVLRDGKTVKEIRRVTGVKCKMPNTATSKAFRKICFATKYDNWRFLKLEEVTSEKEL